MENWHAGGERKNPRPVIGSFKGINKDNKDFFPNFYIKFRILKLRLLAFSRGPGGFRELREAGRNHFHLSWYLSDYVVTSYGQKPWYLQNFPGNTRESSATIPTVFIYVYIYIYVLVVHEESESEVEKCQLLEPGKNRENLI